MRQSLKEFIQSKYTCASQRRLSRMRTATSQSTAAYPHRSQSTTHLKKQGNGEGSNATEECSATICITRCTSEDARCSCLGSSNIRGLRSACGDDGGRCAAAGSATRANCDKNGRDAGSCGAAARAGGGWCRSSS